MTRRSFVQINGKLYERGVDDIPDMAGLDAGRGGTATVMGDLPDFVSPIDGSVVRGRAGMREHCKKHDVVPTSDLAGLPNKPMVMPISEQYRQNTRNNIAEIINSGNYKF